jgi:hypothetical protein
MIALMTETENSGRDVETDNRMKPAAISDSPKISDNAKTYLMTLSLNTPISNRDMNSRGML